MLTNYNKLVTINCKPFVNYLYLKLNYATSDSESLTKITLSIHSKEDN